MSLLALLLSVAVLIVIALAAYAIYLHWQLREQEKRREAQLKALQVEADKQRDRINKSIQVIAAAMGSDQMTLTEGAMRLSVLLQSLGLSEEVLTPYSSLFKLAEATAHIPILEEWKKLPLKQRLAFDQQREALEADYRDLVMDSAKQLLNKNF
ncbi:DUF2489 domain-containing protein [Pseudoteredinibacter isoporae]|uniref:DUF2489 domain-containing protein n=1 Tax=Pseudoteredinibacter isoporae TaxID=570281 RepID=A0A7X0JUL5_9GAMM|nr:DUF2489 domain-containing protein [Pseudoteredinibacter isoporae]MBB6521978.1 hypothetical protein [Pseudoteredinibacter isoporae]NHO87514.1 DUF2489 domain-containing protein [Pseudoteredinibacter isoporae]NIB24155.1 DUF2489 domain-containing protein [Pseudoteredinibacter isoporae]